MNTAVEFYRIVAPRNTQNRFSFATRVLKC